MFDKSSLDDLEQAMATALIAFVQKQQQQHKSKSFSAAVAEDWEKLREENKLLAKQLEESRRRESEILQELNKALRRVKIAEEGEEMLCNQLAQLEAEFLQREIAFNQQIRHLQQSLPYGEVLPV